MAVLGGILLDNEALHKAIEVLRPADFYRESHQHIFACLLELSERGEPADLVTLTSRLQEQGTLENIGGSDYLATLVDYVPTAANILYYCRLVKEKATARELIKVATEIARQGYEGQDIATALDWAEQSIFQVASERGSTTCHAARDVLHETFKAIQNLYYQEGSITGVATGFSDLDGMTAGFQNGDLIVIAGRPSMGKTALVMNMVEHACMELEEPVTSLIFSLEMSKEQLMQRMLCSVSRVNASRLRTGNLGSSDWPKLTQGAGYLSEASIYIDDTPGISVLELRAKARRLRAEKGLGLIVVDYLQLMQGSSGERGGEKSRQQEISDISRALKALARELQVPVIALSQLNRSLENRTDKRPMNADLRESGAIEQDADLILFVYREAVYCEACRQRDGSCDKGHEKDAEVIVGKQRNGPVGTVHLTFLGEYTRFENQSRRQEQ